MVPRSTSEKGAFASRPHDGSRERQCLGTLGGPARRRRADGPGLRLTAAGVDEVGSYGAEESAEERRQQRYSERLAGCSLADRHDVLTGQLPHQLQAQRKTGAEQTSSGKQQEVSGPTRFLCWRFLLARNEVQKSMFASAISRCIQADNWKI